MCRGLNVKVKDHFVYNEPEQLSFDFGVIDNRKDNKKQGQKAKEAVPQDRTKDMPI